MAYSACMVTFANRTSVGTLLIQPQLVGFPNFFAVYSTVVQSIMHTYTMRIHVLQKLIALLKLLSNPTGDSL
jgi:hypothetical protein